MTHVATSAAVRHICIFVKDNDKMDQKQNVYNLQGYFRTKRIHRPKQKIHKLTGTIYIFKP